MVPIKGKKGLMIPDYDTLYFCAVKVFIARRQSGVYIANKNVNTKSHPQSDVSCYKVSRI